MSGEKQMGFYYENIFSQKIKKIGHGITTWNSIPSSNTVTEFSKTFQVFYKWPDLTAVQVVLTYFSTFLGIFPRKSLSVLF
jgi:hypothetical protein